MRRTCCAAWMQASRLKDASAILANLAAYKA